MGAIYRGLAVIVAVAVAAVGVFLAFPARPDETGARPVAAPSAGPGSSGPPGAQPTLEPTLEPTAEFTAEPAAEPTAAPSAGASVEPTVEPASAPGDATTPTPRPIPTPGASLAPGYTAMEALYADERVPRLPRKLKRLSLPRASKNVLRDKRAGLILPDLPKPWKSYGPAPFTSRQVLPPPRRGPRGMLVSCPVPIDPQKSDRDTALLAARWTLNHHPEGAVIRWLGSQRTKAGWALLYQVTYGKRSSRAAVVIVDGGMSKPGLVFISVPDTQRSRWRDIPRVIAGVRALR
ncbi:hypothetical protein ACQEUU_35865 [Nonomuraea sp. CA-218870]|uniref:hypothetical protein n=1 Tax=Nonomuraea sp. CA-218870 TaxID=3239998 RepID=UPI003D91D220